MALSPAVDSFQDHREQNCTEVLCMGKDQSTGRRVPMPLSGSAVPVTLTNGLLATTVNQQVVDVGTSATPIVAANTARASLILFNKGTATIYVGESGVTTANGFPVAAGGTYTVGPNEDHSAIYGIVAADTHGMLVREISYA